MLNLMEGDFSFGFLFFSVLSCIWKTVLAASPLTNICYPIIKLQNCKGLTAGGTFRGLKSNCFLHFGWVTTSDQVHCSFIWLVLEKLQGCSQLPCRLSSWWKRFSRVRAKLLLGIRVCRLASQASTCVSSSKWNRRCFQGDAESPDHAQLQSTEEWFPFGSFKSCFTYASARGA